MKPSPRFLSLLGVLGIFSLLGLFVLITSQLIQSPTRLYERSLWFFGTEVVVKIYHQDITKVEQSFQALEELYQHIHQDWSSQEQGGLLTQINQAFKAQQPIAVPPSVADFIQSNQIISEKSRGYFQPAIGHLVDLWNFHSDAWQQSNPPFPKPSSIQTLLSQKPTIKDIVFERKGDEVWIHSLNPHLKLDVGGSAKGYALDLTFDLLQSLNIQNALINAGGDIRTLGSAPKKDYWDIGIQNPQMNSDLPLQKVLSSLKLYAGEAVATSSNQYRFFTYQGKRYGHLINPKTGYPVSHKQSVSVVAHSGLLADSAATALFVSPNDEMDSIAQNLEVIGYIWVDEVGEVYTSPSLDDRVP